jgi:hypothetical protein
MYNLIRGLRSSPFGVYRTLLEPAPIIPPATSLELPAEFCAVRFYTGGGTPARQKDVSEAIVRMVESLGELMPVVSMDPQLRLDEHQDFDLPGVQQIPELEPSVNLRELTGAIAKASVFVGSYGGFSYIAPHVGVPALVWLAQRPESGGVGLTHLAMIRRLLSWPEFGDYLVLTPRLADRADALAAVANALHGRSTPPAPKLSQAPDARMRREPKPRGIRRTSYLYFSLEREPDRPVRVFHYIPYTDMSAVWRLIESNNRDAEISAVKADPQRSRVEFERALRERLLSFGVRRTLLRCICSPFGTRFLAVVDQPTNPFMLVRDPVERVHAMGYEEGITLYRSLEDARPRAHGLREAVRVLGPSGKQRVDEVVQQLNSQSRSLLDATYDAGDLSLTPEEPDADLWRERLFAAADRFMVGTQSRLAESVELFAREFGWEVPVDPSSAGEQNGAAGESTAEEQELVRRYNWLDQELFTRCEERLLSALGASASVRG